VPFHELVPLGYQLSSALGHAHSRGIVHRDVKAENVPLDAHSGGAMVTDFGIARVTEAQPLTATGTVLGTVQYMSPEQVTGTPLDGRSDLYALGVLAFYASTGRFPSSVNDRLILPRERSSQIPHPVDLSPQDEG